MCGIAGWFSPTRDLREEHRILGAMSRTMTCRGPDADGTWTEGRVALVHRRLAVLDPEGGVQPMVQRRPDGSELVISYSGETYNFRELRAQLEDLGHVFMTRSDTEVVLAGFEEWGLGLPARLVGMFAFAVWDTRTQELTLVRDRLGVKPLHLTRRGGEVLFGSEPKALLAHPDVPARVDDDGLMALFTLFGVHRPGSTALQGIEEVPAGCCAVVSARGMELHRYWHLEPSEHTDTPQETVERVRALLTDAVGGQLLSDVPLCSLLSGGLDSAAVTALAHQASVRQGRDLATFTVDFAGLAEHFVPDADRPDLDSPHAQLVAEHLGTDHSRVVVPVQDMLELQARATRARDLPAMGDLDSSLLSLFGAVRERYTVALSGESADELFGGYAWFHDERATARDGFPWMMDDLGLANLLRPDLCDRIDPVARTRSAYRSACAAVPLLDSETAESARQRTVSHLALTHFLPVLLDRKDRTSMAVGVEVRVPFCDHRLVEYVWNVPWHLKVGTSGPPEPKALLREACRDLLPESIVRRPKAMFPVVPDPAYERLVHERAMALRDRGRLGGLLDPERVDDLVQGRSRRPVWMQRMALGYLVQMDLWLEEYDVEVLV